jgi:uncharacterized protein (DUF305 family)
MLAARMDEPTADGDDDDVTYVPGLSYPKVAVLVAVCALLAGALGWVLGDRSSGEDTGGSAVDEGFVVDMRTHHEQAIEMALLELAAGEHEEVIAYAREILVRQNVELGLMAAELEDWGVPVGERPPTAMAWMGTPVPVEEMPGLASEAEMAALREATGQEADRLFLQLMVEHHRGGVHMAEYAAEHGTADDVRRLAASMAAIQSVEIDEFLATARRRRGRVAG